MEKDDATNIAVGGTLLGIGSVTLGILIPLAAAARSDPWTAVWFLVPVGVAGLFGGAGLYVLTAVYTGWWLPRTASARETAPRLRVVETIAASVKDQDVVVRIKLMNDGRGNIDDATVNVAVPAWVSALQRCNPDGTPRESGGVHRSPEPVSDDEDGPSIYWAGPLDFPGRVTRSVHVKVTLSPLRSFPSLIHVTAIELDEVFEHRFTIDPNPD